MGKKKILYLTHDGLTDPLGRSQILPYLCGLSQEYEIVIVSFEKPDRYASQKRSVEEIVNSHKIKWVPLAYHKSPRLLSTVYDVFCLYQNALRLNKLQNFDIVHCRSYVTALVGMRLKMRHALKFVFDMRGFWADERVEGGLWNLTNPVYRLIYGFFKKREKEFLQCADHVVVLTEAAKKIIVEWGTAPSKITVIPCCVDMDLFSPNLITSERRLTTRLTLGFDSGDFVLLYLGSWGTWYLTDEMITFFKKIKLRIPNARFLILTTDRVEIKDQSIHDSVVIRSVSRQEVPLFIALSDAAVFFIKNSFSKQGSSATKMAEIMAMNIPVVTNTGWGDIEAQQGKIPGLISVTTPVDFELAIQRMQESYSNIRAAIQNEFALSRGIEKYESIYAQLK